MTSLKLVCETGDRLVISGFYFSDKRYDVGSKYSYRFKIHHQNYDPAQILKYLPSNQSSLASFGAGSYKAFGILNCPVKDNRTFHPITMGLFCSRRSKDNEIISKESLSAVLDVIEFLKINVHGEWMFRQGGNPVIQRKILSSLIRGDRDRLRNNWADSTIETAAALQLFLTNLREPLIPSRVQQLVLADNTGVPEKTVALDALGLLQQELSRRHLTLVMALLDLLHTVTCRVSSELTTSPLSDVLLPVFFDVQDLMHCTYNQKRQIQSTYNELILAGPYAIGQQCFWPSMRSNSSDLNMF